MSAPLKRLLLAFPFALAAAAFLVSRGVSSPRPAPVETLADEGSSSGPEQAEQPASAQEPPPAVERATVIATDIQAARYDTGVPDEAAIMAKLRRLGAASFAESLALARSGNEYFPHSPDAPERDWIIVKSLVSLRRFHEARDEAELMIRRYPGDPRSLDVKRHLLRLEGAMLA